MDVDYQVIIVVKLGDVIILHSTVFKLKNNILTVLQRVFTTAVVSVSVDVCISVQQPSFNPGLDLVMDGVHSLNVVLIPLGRIRPKKRWKFRDTKW